MEDKFEFPDMLAEVIARPEFQAVAEYDTTTLKFIEHGMKVYELEFVPPTASSPRERILRNAIAVALEEYSHKGNDFEFTKRTVHGEKKMFMKIQNEKKPNREIISQIVAGQGISCYPTIEQGDDRPS